MVNDELLEDKISGKTKALGRATKKAVIDTASSLGRAVAPEAMYLPLEQQVDLTLKMHPQLQQAIGQIPQQYHSLIQERLIYHLRNQRIKKADLKTSAGTLETMNRYAEIGLAIASPIKGIPFFGKPAHFLLRAGKNLMMLPLTISNSTYYAARTGDYGAVAKDTARATGRVVLTKSFNDQGRYSARVDEQVIRGAGQNLIKDLQSGWLQKEYQRRNRFKDIGEEERKEAYERQGYNPDKQPISEGEYPQRGDIKPKEKQKPKERSDERALAA